MPEDVALRFEPVFPDASQFQGPVGHSITCLDLLAPDCCAMRVRIYVYFGVWAGSFGSKHSMDTFCALQFVRVRALEVEVDVGGVEAGAAGAALELGQPRRDVTQRRRPAKRRTDTAVHLHATLAQVASRWKTQANCEQNPRER